MVLHYAARLDLIYVLTVLILIIFDVQLHYYQFRGKEMFSPFTLYTYVELIYFC